MFELTLEKNSENPFINHNYKDIIDKIKFFVDKEKPYLTEIDKYIHSKLSFYLKKIEEMEAPDYKIKIGFIGPYSSGKTTLINSFLGFELGLTGPLPITGRIFRIKYEPGKKFISSSGKTKSTQITKTAIEAIRKNNQTYYYPYDEFNTLYKTNKVLFDDVDSFNVYVERSDITDNNFVKFDFQLFSKIEIIDTPGYDSANEIEKNEAINIIPDLDIILYVNGMRKHDIIKSSEIDFIRLNELYKTEINFILNSYNMGKSDIIKKLNFNLNAVKRSFPKINGFFAIDGKKTFEVKNADPSSGSIQFGRLNELISDNILTKDINNVIYKYIDKIDFYRSKIKYRLLNKIVDLYINLSTKRQGAKFSDELSEKQDSHKLDKKEIDQEFKYYKDIVDSNKTKLSNNIANGIKTKNDDIDMITESISNDIKLNFDDIFRESIKIHDDESTFNKTFSIKFDLFKNNIIEKINKQFTKRQKVNYDFENEIRRSIVLNEKYKQEEKNWLLPLSSDQSNTNLNNLKNYLQKVYEKSSDDFKRQINEHYEKIFLANFTEELLKKIEENLRDLEKTTAKFPILKGKEKEFIRIVDDLIYSIEQIIKNSDIDSMKNKIMDEFDSNLKKASDIIEINFAKITEQKLVKINHEFNDNRKVFIGNNKNLGSF